MIAAVIVLIIVAVAAIFITNGYFANKPFYVGVTYGGDSTAEAKLLIDKVKDYTNLFVLQSGPLMGNTTDVNEIGDYAIANGLHFAAYFSALIPPQGAEWLGTAQQRWGDMFAGVYYGDELGGTMLDSTVDLTYRPDGVQNSGSTKDRLMKNIDGSVAVGETTYSPNGEISVTKSNYSWPDTSFWQSDDDNAVFVNNYTRQTTIYQPNGSIAIYESYIVYNYYPTNSSAGSPEVKDHGEACFTMDNGSDRIAQAEPYQQVKSRNLLTNCSSVANAFVNSTATKVNGLINQWQLSNRSFPIFTADYGLYWWEYQAGYDMVLTELGWNNSVAKEIGLVRGAANLQGKDWGTIVTWKYTQEPYLPGEDEMFDEMKTSYECGASYVIVFNYARNGTSSFGTLKDDHFHALERFWNEVVKNPQVAHGTVKAEAALVLPHDLGGGAGHKIWGIWEPNGTSQQAETAIENRLTQYGLKIDIVYEDSAYPLGWKYPQVYYWNQTG